MNIKKGGDIKNLYNEIIHNNYTFNNSSLQVLNSYGNNVIQSIQIRKSPINKSLILLNNRIIELISYNIAFKDWPIVLKASTQT